MFKKFNVTVIDKVLTLGNDNTTLEESGKVDERHLKLSHKQYKEFIDHSINFICSDKTDTNFEDTINLLRQLKIMLKLYFYILIM